MKIYALIAVASACLFLTSCSNDDMEQEKNINKFQVSNSSMMREDGTGADSTSVPPQETDPIKTNGKD